MRIYCVNNLNFESKKYRIPVKRLVTKYGNIKVDLAKEYSKPNAQNMFEQARQEPDLRKK